MRSLLVELFLPIFLVAILFAPHLGPALYYWLTWMAPHQISWTLLPFSIPWVKITAIFSLAALLVSKQSFKGGALHPLFLLIVVLLSWTLVTSLIAFHREAAVAHWIEFAKMVLMVFVTIAVIDTREKLHLIIFILVISLGFYAAKGAVGLVLAGGGFLVLGPPGSAIAQTNEIARAFLMTLPLTVYLALHSANAFIRILLWAVAIILTLATLGTESRGAFLALAAMMIAFWLKSNYKIKSLIFAIIISLAIVSVISPEKYEQMVQRFSTISEFETDKSAQSRFDVWERSKELISNNPITGGGFDVFELSLGKASHNTFVEIAGEHGLPGLSLFILIISISYLTVNRCEHSCAEFTELYWIRDLAFLFKVCLIGYVVGSLTKNHAFFQYLYVIFALSIIIDLLRREKIAEIKKE